METDGATAMALMNIFMMSPIFHDSAICAHASTEIYAVQLEPYPAVYKLIRLSLVEIQIAEG